MSLYRPRYSVKAMALPLALGAAASDGATMPPIAQSGLGSLELAERRLLRLFRKGGERQHDLAEAAFR